METVCLWHSVFDVVSSFLESVWKLFYCGLGWVLNLHSCFLFVTAVSGRKCNKKLLTKKKKTQPSYQMEIIINKLQTHLITQNRSKLTCGTQILMNLRPNGVNLMKSVKNMTRSYFIPKEIRYCIKKMKSFVRSIKIFFFFGPLI